MSEIDDLAEAARGSMLSRRERLMAKNDDLSSFFARGFLLALGASPVLFVVLVGAYFAIEAIWKNRAAEAARELERQRPRLVWPDH